MRPLLTLLLCAVASAQTYNEVVLVGQSLAKGFCQVSPPGTGTCFGASAGTNTAYPVTNPNKTYWAGSLVNLTNPNMGGTDSEYSVIGAINQITSESASQAWRGVGNVGDVASGANYNSLKSGTAAYTAFTTAHAALPGLVTGAGYTYGGCAASLNVHGEADFSGFGVTAATYKTNVTTWQNDVETSCGSSSVPMFISQISVWWTASTPLTKATPVDVSGNDGVPLGQLAAARAAIGKIYIIGPKYALQAFSALPHLTEHSYLAVAEQNGHAIKTVLIDGAYWTGVQPKSYTRVGTTVTAHFYVQHTPLVIDTTMVTDRTTGSAGAYSNCYGFEAFDNTTPINFTTCNSSILTASDTVTLTLASTPVGTFRLKYAYTSPGSPELGTGNRGNLRDSDTAIGRLSGAHLYNWCVTFNDAIASFVDPGYPVVPNPRSVLSTHPRILLNDTIADTWEPSKGRLTAVRDRANGGNATATSDLATLTSAVNALSGSYSAHGDNAALLDPGGAVFLSLMLKNSDPTNSDAYAAGVWTWLSGLTWTNIGSDDSIAFRAEAVALFYDWCNDWIVANGHQAAVITHLKDAYALLTINATPFRTSIREGDMHNYTVEIENAILAIGLSLWGDDPAGATILDEGWGYFYEGWQVTNPAGFATLGETYTYKIKSTVDLTGGSMSLEGPVYWRSNVPELARGIEAYDTATGRVNAVWTPFAALKNAGDYKIYTLRPDGKYPGMGADATDGTLTAGRDNFAMVILVDRFQDTYQRYFMDNSVTGGAFDSGSGGQTGLVWKETFYPYLNGPTATAYTSLPTARQFVSDTVIRSGWTTTDTFLTFSQGNAGVYHRPDSVGDVSLYAKSVPMLVRGGPYSVSTGDYYRYFRSQVAGNGLTIYDATDCIKWNQNVCGIDSFGTIVPNTGGPRPTQKRYTPQFPADANRFGQDKMWSATLFTDVTYGSRYASVLNFGSHTLDNASTYAAIASTLTPAWSNFAGTGDNPNDKVSLLTRQVIYIKPGASGQDYVAVFDNVISTNAAFPKKALWHTVGPMQVNTGSWATPAAGINSYTPTKMRTDNGTARLFMTPLLPATATARVVGGNSCSNITITAATNANPAVFTSTGHGLIEGEQVAIDAGGAFCAWCGVSGQYLDYRSDPGYQREIAYIDANHFSLRRIGTTTLLNSSAMTAFATSYPSGVPIIYHGTCGWEGWLDDNGVGVSRNYWYPANLNTSFESASKGQWRVEMSPASSNMQDPFLSVLMPSTTSTTDPPVETLLSSATTYAAQIIDPSTPYVAAFARTLGATSLAYTTSYTGTGRHFISGMAVGTYAITVSGTPVSGSPFTVGSGGSLTFTSAAGPVVVGTSSATMPGLRALPSPIGGH